MYDFPELRAETDALWQAIRRDLGDAPDALDREIDPWEAWQSPGLLLSQTCSLPFRKHLVGRVTLVASPDHALPGCAPGYYRSVLVARRDDARGLSDLLAARIAANGTDSQSGYAALMSHATGLGLHPSVALITGSHRASARAVAEGRADLAALDAQSWRLIARHDAAATALRVADETAPSPALPYITARGRDPERLRAALSAAIAALPQSSRDALGLQGVVALPERAYTALPLPPEC
nr:PhnD/SsuA/transferrin family substrate-binding protein [Thalassococcus arenae]